MFKTRSAATRAVLGGRVHVNGMRVKPSKEVQVGDTVDVTGRSVKRTIRIADVAEKRGSAAVAATLYVEAPESIRAREEAALERRLTRPPGADLGARPTSSPAGVWRQCAAVGGMAVRPRAGEPTLGCS